ncbi:uncharacterized protein LOC130655366 isoform X3 [Hydractinia symbiolongicarpus]|uniref:uncharacterized protein LOC130655366 isoform X3 n=1 Tax=Hydractinia symbiolongicarpus TaxID=13093 RepID=UPI002549CB2D|nr:uncharacterized protein LOC130655366 isoform X3 [Hydractinia symbiolongicarpus]
MNEKDNDDVDDDDTDGNDQVQDNVSDLVDNENGNYVMSDNESTVCSGESDSEESVADQNRNVASRARVDVVDEVDQVVTDVEDSEWALFNTCPKNQRNLVSRFGHVAKRNPRSV